MAKKFASSKSTGRERVSMTNSSQKNFTAMSSLMVAKGRGMSTRFEWVTRGEERNEFFTSWETFFFFVDSCSSGSLIRQSRASFTSLVRFSLHSKHEFPIFIFFSLTSSLYIFFSVVHVSSTRLYSTRESCYLMGERESEREVSPLVIVLPT